jgi:hypothetical protein
MAIYLPRASLMVMSAASCVWLDLRHSITKACILPRPKHTTFPTVHLPSFPVFERIFFSFARASLLSHCSLYRLCSLTISSSVMSAKGFFKILCDLSLLIIDFHLLSVTCVQPSSELMYSIFEWENFFFGSASAFPFEAFFFRFV